MVCVWAELAVLEGKSQGGEETLSSPVYDEKSQSFVCVFVFIWSSEILAADLAKMDVWVCGDKHVKGAW